MTEPIIGLATYKDAYRVANALADAVRGDLVFEGAEVRKLHDDTTWFELILPDGKLLRVQVIH